jgi:hypothetical protein
LKKANLRPPPLDGTTSRRDAGTCKTGHSIEGESQAGPDKWSIAGVMMVTKADTMSRAVKQPAVDIVLSGRS